MKYKVVQGTDEQREVLRGLSEASYTKGLMDTLILRMTPSQVRSAHDHHKLSEITELHVANEKNRLDDCERPARVLRPPATIKKI